MSSNREAAWENAKYVVQFDHNGTWDNYYFTSSLGQAREALRTGKHLDEEGECNPLYRINRPTNDRRIWDKQLKEVVEYKKMTFLGKVRAGFTA
ncbi:MAG: hypothetical protein AAFO63_00020 [Pseudomonadota bacterium]